MDSQHVSKTKQVISFLLPSTAEVAFLTSAALLVLIIGNASSIWQIVVQGANASLTTSETAVQPYTTYIDEALGHSLLGSATVMLFWAALGSLAYMGIWLFFNVFSHIEAEKEEAHYVDGRMQQHTDSYWHSVAFGHGFLLASILLASFVVIAALRMVFPYASALLEFALYSGPWLERILSAAWGVIALAITLYVVKLVLYAVRYSWHRSFGN